MTYSQFENVSLRLPVDGMAYCDPKQHPLPFPPNEMIRCRAPQYVHFLFIAPFIHPFGQAGCVLS
jgi:hypothetical protein